MQSGGEGIQLYGFSMSQPTRAVMTFFRLMDIPYTLKFTSILTGDNRKPEFLEFNPTGKIPVIKDFNLNTVVFESEAIVKHLAVFYCEHCLEKRQKWYPMGAGSNEQKLMAVRMQMYLSWHHTNIRMGMQLFKGLSGVYDNKEFLIQQGETYLKSSLEFMDKHFCDKSDYLAGDRPTFADIQAIHELILYTQFPKYWEWVSDKKNHPNLIAWMNRMLQVQEVQAEYEKYYKKRVPLIE